MLWEYSLLPHSRKKCLGTIPHYDVNLLVAIGQLKLMELTPSSLKADTQKLQQQSLPTPKVYHIKFWMRHYSSPSMKPTMIVTNSLALGALDKGPVRGFKKRTAKRTAKRYQDSKGKKRFAGNSTLKKSQKLCCKAFLMASHFPLRHWHWVVLGCFFLVICSPLIILFCGIWYR